MQEFPVIIAYGKHPKEEWNRVPSSLRDVLSEKLREKLSHVQIDAGHNWSDHIVLEDERGKCHTFAVALNCEKFRFTKAEYPRLLNHGYSQADLDRFPPPSVWNVYTFNQNPTLL